MKRRTVVPEHARRGNSEQPSPAQLAHVAAAGVAKRRQVGPHGLGHLWEDGSGCIIVQIDAVLAGRVRLAEAGTGGGGSGVDGSGDHDALAMLAPLDGWLGRTPGCTCRWAGGLLAAGTASWTMARAGQCWESARLFATRATESVQAPIASERQDRQPPAPSDLQSRQTRLFISQGLQPARPHSLVAPTMPISVLLHVDAAGAGPRLAGERSRSQAVSARRSGWMHVEGKRLPSCSGSTMPAGDC